MLSSSVKVTTREKFFFKDLYQTLRLNIFEYTFDEHDETVAYSLSIPFVSTFVFAAVMKHQEAPGTTFKKHMAIAKGLLSEDDYLLQEILFNPRHSLASGKYSSGAEEFAGNYQYEGCGRDEAVSDED